MHTPDASEAGLSTKTRASAASIAANTTARQSEVPPRIRSRSIQGCLSPALSATTSLERTHCRSSRAYEMKTGAAIDSDARDRYLVVQPSLVFVPDSLT